MTDLEVEPTLSRIAVLSDVFPPQKGGSGRWLFEIYSRFPTGVVTFIAGQQDGDEEFDTTRPGEQIRRVPLSLSDWGTLRPRSFLRYARLSRKVGRIVRYSQIAVVHAARVLPEGWIAYFLRQTHGIPYVVYVHGEDICAASWSREQSWMVRRVLNKAEKVLANSKNTAKILKEEWSMNCQLLYPGVDCDYFSQTPRDETVRSELGWGTRPTVLTVGRLQKRKGHDMMIEAIPLIRREFPGFLYAICGDGDERVSLQEKVGDLEVDRHVQFMGEVSDSTLLSAYQQCDVFALPNREVDRDIEGFGMVLVEAQSCGRPVLAGDSGGTRETMAVGETGVIVDCTDVDVLARAIIDLLSDKSARDLMGARAALHVRERFDWKILSEQAIQLFS